MVTDLGLMTVMMTLFSSIRPWGRGEEGEGRKVRGGSGGREEGREGRKGKERGGSERWREEGEGLLNQIIISRP